MWLAIYSIILLEALTVSALLVPLTMRVALRCGYFAIPGGRHIHAKPTPTLGGMAIVFGFLIVLFGNLAISHPLEPWLRVHLPQIAMYIGSIHFTFHRLEAVLFGALIMSALGLVDDRHPLRPELKMGIMILATIPLLLAGIRIEGFLPWPWAGSTLTILWVVFLTNSFNFLDNMDGLTGGIAAIVSLAFGLISFFSGQWFITAIYAALAGALLGFLWHNISPARTFMGDNGSLFIGYLIGSLSILSTYYKPGEPSILPILTPIVVLGVPIFDTLSVMWIRWRTHQPLMQGDKNHFSHRLVDLGMSRRYAVTFIYILTGVVALGAIPMRAVGTVGGIAILVQTALIFVIIHRLERTANTNKKSQ